jgi:hypothetical protein
MSNDNTQDGAEPSPASAGSQNTHMATARLSAANTWLQEEIKRLRLTDAEREAIERLCEAVTEYSDIDRKENGCHADDDMAAVAVARGLMKRMV